MQVDKILVRGLKNNGDLEEKKTDELPDGSDLIEIQQRGDWLWYRLYDSNKVLLEVGLYPSWMLVKIEHTSV